MPACKGSRGAAWSSTARPTGWGSSCAAAQAQPVIPGTFHPPLAALVLGSAGCSCTCGRLLPPSPCSRGPVPACCVYGKACLLQGPLSSLGPSWPSWPPINTNKQPDRGRYLPACCHVVNAGLQVAVLTAVDCSPAVWMSSAAPALAVVGALAAQQLAAAGPGSPETPSSAACATVSTGVLDNWATVETAAAPDHRCGWDRLWVRRHSLCVLNMQPKCFGRWHTIVALHPGQPHIYCWRSHRMLNTLLPRAPWS